MTLGAQMVDVVEIFVMESGKNGIMVHDTQSFLTRNECCFQTFENPFLHHVFF